MHQVDRLYDCYNSSVAFHFKDVHCGVSAKSCHMDFIRDITIYINSMEVCAPLPRVHIHCIVGWLINLTSLHALWQDLQSYKIKYLLTCRLNQDCLEHLLAKLRIKFGNCDHPSAYNFTKGLKSVMTTDILKVPSSGNCEVDESHFLDLFQTGNQILTLNLKIQW